jgi:hypothetical protein
MMKFKTELVNENNKLKKKIIALENLISTLEYELNIPCSVCHNLTKKVVIK